MKTTSFFIFFTLFIQFSCNPGISEKSQDMLAQYKTDYSCYNYSVGKSGFNSDSLTFKTIYISFEGCNNYETLENNFIEIENIAKEVYLSSPDTNIYNGITIEFLITKGSSSSKEFVFYYDKKEKSLKLVSASKTKSNDN